MEGNIEWVICAVRGTPESRQTVTRAIDLAVDHHARLTFFLVLDAEFLGKSMPSFRPVQIVYEQLEQMAEFSMLILCDRARRRGVERVNYIIRRGNIPKQMRKMAIETGADVMVIGRPIRRRGRRVFEPEEFDRFIYELEEQGQIKVITVAHGGGDEQKDEHSQFTS